MTADDQPPRPRSYEAERKQAAREKRYQHRREDPRHRGQGILFNPLSGFDHGTEYGYVEFGCRCIDRGPLVEDPSEAGSIPIPTGCGTVGPAAAAARTRARRARHRKEDRPAAVTSPSRVLPPPSGSALQQLDQLMARRFGGGQTGWAEEVFTPPGGWPSTR